MAAGSVTITTQSPLRGPGRPVWKLTLAWTSDASGAVNGTLTDYVAGEIVRVVFVPGTAGSQPTNGYSLTLLDENGLDVLEGQGASLSNAAASEAYPGGARNSSVSTDVAPVSVNDKLNLTITGAGNAKSGTLVLYVR